MIIPTGVTVRASHFVPTWQDRREPSVAVWMWTRANRRTRGKCPWPQERVMYRLYGEIVVSPENFELLAQAIPSKDQT